MELFLDTAKIDEIRRALDWGILDGVTTNPTHIAATGRRFREVVEEICALVPGPVSLEVVGTTADQMVAEAQDLARIGPNVVVKIPTIEEGIKATTRLTQMGIKTNLTLVFSAAQALLAAKAGATYVSPFVGRLDGIGHSGSEVVGQIKTIYDNYGYDTKIIVAAVRHPMHILEAALIGAQVVTSRLDILEQLFHHPMTDAGLEQFLADWAKVPQ
ncbi:MAG: fructose-6-phosphate aldolase [Anaerolineae bacterium]|nr:fructose-6-phosphate aldolase [Anaerolineae bacterium]